VEEGGEGLRRRAAAREARHLKRVEDARRAVPLEEFMEEAGRRAS
jgi:hypothetical protein